VSVLRVFLSPSIGNVSKKPSILLNQFTIQCGKLEDGQNLAPLLLIALVHQFLYEICYIFSFFGHCEQIKPFNQLSNRQSVVWALRHCAWGRIQWPGDGSPTQWVSSGTCGRWTPSIRTVSHRRCEFLGKKVEKYRN